MQPYISDLHTLKKRNILYIHRHRNTRHQWWYIDCKGHFINEYWLRSTIELNWFVLFFLYVLDLIAWNKNLISSGIDRWMILVCVCICAHIFTVARMFLFVPNYTNMTESIEKPKHFPPTIIFPVFALNHFFTHFANEQSLYGK